MPAPALLALAPLLQSLAASGLGLIGNAILAKGKAVVEEKLGVNIEESVQTEEGRIKLMQLQAQKEADLHAFVLAQRQQEIDAEKIDAENVASARHMQEAALAQGDAFSKRFVYVLAIIWSIAAILYVGFITFVEIPESNVRHADTILGFLLGTVVATILNFFFGSSTGSRASGAVLHEIARKATGGDK